MRLESWQVREEVKVRVQVLGQQLLGHGRRVEVVLDVRVLLVDLLLQGHPVSKTAGVKLCKFFESQQHLVVVQLVLEPVFGGEPLPGKVFDHEDGLVASAAVGVVDERGVAVGEAVVQGRDVESDLVAHALLDEHLQVGQQLFVDVDLVFEGSIPPDHTFKFGRLFRRNFDKEVVNFRWLGVVRIVFVIRLLVLVFGPGLIVRLGVGPAPARFAVRRREGLRGGGRHGRVGHFDDHSKSGAHEVVTICRLNWKNKNKNVSINFQ